MQIARRACRQRTGIGGAQRQLHGIGDGLGDIGLNGEQGFGVQRTVVGFCPQVNIGCAVNQLHIDAYLVAGTLHATFQYNCGTQFAGNLRDGQLGIDIVHHRCARDHFEASDLRQLGEQIVMDAIDKISILRVAAAIAKWQHRNQALDGRCRCRQRRGCGGLGSALLRA